MWGELSAVSELVPSEGEETHLRAEERQIIYAASYPFKEGTQPLPAP